MTIIQPSTPGEMDEYFAARFETLRKPWGQPRGSERDNGDDSAFHSMAVENGIVAGVCRMQFNSASEAQLRFMGVKEEFRGKGVGDQLIAYCENEARIKGRKTMILHAREKAVNFYLKNGYSVKEKSYLMWNEIQHFLMEKTL